MKKKIISLLICALLIFVSVVPVCATENIVNPDTTLENVTTPLYLAFTGQITINGGNIDLSRENNGKSAIQIAPGCNVTIVIPAGKTLIVKGGNANYTIGAGAGIEVPANSSLTIIGRGELEAYGGNAASGTKGDNGLKAYYGSSSSRSGAGGRGGIGGGGAGAAIGSKGGNGGSGGNGGAAVNAPNTSDGIRSGMAGQNGSSGSRASNFGQIKISKSIKLTAKGGTSPSNTCTPATYGEPDSGGSFRIYASYGGGGGGQGGTGYPAADIGSGGNGAAGGGGGGSGATELFYIKASFEAANGTGYGGQGGIGYYNGVNATQVENTGLDEGCSGGAGGQSGFAEPYHKTEATDVFFDEDLAASTISSGSLPIVIGAACVAAAIIIFIVINKKKAN